MSKSNFSCSETALSKTQQVFVNEEFPLGSDFWLKFDLHNCSSYRRMISGSSLILSFFLIYLLASKASI